MVMLSGDIRFFLKASCNASGLVDFFDITLASVFAIILIRYITNR